VAGRLGSVDAARCACSSLIEVVCAQNVQVIEYFREIRKSGTKNRVNLRRYSSIRCAAGVPQFWQTSMTIARDLAYPLIPKIKNMIGGFLTWWTDSQDTACLFHGQVNLRGSRCRAGPPDLAPTIPTLEGPVMPHTKGSQ
jgi:hypothetical protein